MKKLLLAALALTLTVGAAFAAPFSPNVMNISAPAAIHYEFNGSDLNIPVTITGTPANGVFLVFTKDKGQTISKIQNGYLGWHYVNKIDTCLYVSPFMDMAKGSNNIQWNGKDETGNNVEAGTYSYYIWAFDNVTPKVKMTGQIGFAWENRAIVNTHDVTGAPLAQPIVYDAPQDYSDVPDLRLKTRSRWVIGSDPEDAAMKQTCTYMSWAENSSLALDPADHSKFFSQTLKTDGTLAMWKMQWVPNGEAVRQVDWAEQGEMLYPTKMAAGWSFYSGPISDGGENLYFTDADLQGVGTDANVVVVSVDDGSLIKKIDVSEWWVDMNDGAAGGQNTGGPSDLMFQNGLLMASSHSSCMDQMINPYADTDEDYTVWVNQNGDYTGDHNFETNALRPWVCNDYNVGPYKYSATLDKNLFATIPSFDMGAVSFALYAPDGTGLGYHAFAGETANFKAGERFVDYGSPYDGMYMDNASAAENTGGWWFVGSDSFKGTITNQVAVADAAPAAFSVAQNVPNPFNPTTAISFTLAKAGKTTVEVYNVAGQKVDTLVNASLKAGSHSVTWNASKFSAGVYFYTVKSGSFSKTVKMTLLK